MKKTVIFLVFSLVLLAMPFSLPAYDASADNWKVVPECIWAAASGGGTWKTEIQVTNMTSDPALIKVYFFYGGGLWRGPFTLNSGLAIYRSIKYSNILQTIDLIDTEAFTYYGRVGALFVDTGDSTHHIQVSSKTVNGNYGKTFPGLNIGAATTAAVDRKMIIHNLTNSATYRTFTGFYNTSPTATYSVTFTIIDGYNALVGSQFTKSFPPFEYMAFNPFVEAGASLGTYDNCWLWINPTSGGSDIRGVMAYGAVANNVSNDPSALIALPFN